MSHENSKGRGMIRLDDITRTIDDYADESFEAGWTGALERAIEVVEVHGIDGAEAVKAELRRLLAATSNDYAGPCLNCGHVEAHTNCGMAGCTVAGCDCSAVESRSRYTRIVR